MATKTRVFYGTHASEYMDVYWPYSTTNLQTLIVLIHGGFFKPVWHLNLMEALAKAFQKLGYTVVNIEYPRVGEGKTALEMLESVFIAYDTACMLDPEISKHVVIGHSAGGFYAEWFALRSNFCGTKLWNKKVVTPTKVIPLAPLSDLVRAQREGLSDKHDAVLRFIQSEQPSVRFEEEALKLSPIQYVTQDCPIEIIHGTHDTDVPLSHSISFADNRSNVVLHRTEMNHYEVIEPSYQMMELLQKIILA